MRQPTLLLGLLVFVSVGHVHQLGVAWITLHAFLFH